MNRDSLAALMDSFIRGDDRSLEIAGRIEVALDDLFGDQRPFADLMQTLASYRPSGGPFLYGGAEVVPLMREVLGRVRSSRDR